MTHTTGLATDDANNNNNIQYMYCFKSDNKLTHLIYMYYNWVTCRKTLIKIMYMTYKRLFFSLVIKVKGCHNFVRKDPWKDSNMGLSGKYML